MQPSSDQIFQFMLEQMRNLSGDLSNDQKWELVKQAAMKHFRMNEEEFEKLNNQPIRITW